MIPPEVIDKIRQQADIVDVAQSFIELKKRGNDYWACCPFHHEKTPSFKLNQERQGYYCFGCKEHGGVVDFVKGMLNTDFLGAMRWLGEKYGIDLQENSGRYGNPEEAKRQRTLQERRMSLLGEIAKWYHTLLVQPMGEHARNYLAGRGLDQAAVERFGLGYCPNDWSGAINWASKLGYTMEDLVATGMVTRKDDVHPYHDLFRDRLVFPICNEMGRVVGFSARVLGPSDGFKYVNTPETEFFQKGQILYALHLARSAFKDFGYALVCEGQLDVISCHRAGLTNAIAAQGTAFTEYHAKLLGKSVKKVLLSFDADTAGYKAAERTIKLLYAAGLEPSVVTLPAGEDPDSVFRTGGAEALKQMMDPAHAEGAIPYLYRVSCVGVDANRPEVRGEIVRRVLGAVQPIQDDVVRVSHCQWLAKQMNLPESTVINKLNSLPNPNAVRQRPAEVHPIQTLVRPPMPYDPHWVMLLDMVLHSEEYARKLAFMQDILDMIPTNAVGNALNQVMVMTAQEEWADCQAALTNSPLFQDEAVGRCIMASQCLEWMNKENEENNRVAFEDCLAHIRKQGIDALIQQKRTQLAETQDSNLKNQLMQEISQLIRQKKQGKIAPEATTESSPS